MQISNLIPDILSCINDSPTPMTSAMVAKALCILDVDACARALSSMNQRPKPMIARQPVSPERKVGRSVKYEYLSLALAKSAGVVVASRTKRSGTQDEAVMSFFESHPGEWLIPPSVMSATGITSSNSTSHCLNRLRANGLIESRRCRGRGRGITNEYRLVAKEAPPPAYDLSPIIEVERTSAPLPVVDDIPSPPVPAVETLARLIGRRIARTMMKALQDEIEEQLEAMSNDLIEKWVDEKAKPMIHRTASLPEKERLPRVLIAGLLPSQAGLIKSEFGDVFDLDFYTTDDNLNHLHDKLRGKVDHFFTFTSKVEHAVEGFAKSHGIKINRSSGGMTMLRQKLEQLYVEGEVA